MKVQKYSQQLRHFSLNCHKAHSNMQLILHEQTYSLTDTILPRSFCPSVRELKENLSSGAYKRVTSTSFVESYMMSFWDSAAPTKLSRWSVPLPLPLPLPPGVRRPAPLLLKGVSPLPPSLLLMQSQVLKWSLFAAILALRGCTNPLMMQTMLRRTVATATKFFISIILDISTIVLI